MRNHTKDGNRGKGSLGFEVATTRSGNDGKEGQRDGRGEDAEGISYKRREWLVRVFGDSGQTRVQNGPLAL